MGPFATLGLLALLVCGQAPSTDQPEIAQTVKRLLRELDGAELAGRDAAEAKLAELGPAVLDHLPDAAPRQSAEVRQRLDRVRGKLEKARAEAFVQGSRVTLEKGTYRLSELFAEIEKQTGNKIIDYREEFGQDAPELELKIGFDKALFWEAIDELLDRAALTVYPYAEQAALAVVASTTPQAPRLHHASYAGAFRIEATQLIAERDLRDVNKRSLNVEIEAAWEPRLSPIALQQPLEELKATDSQGNSLGADPDNANLEATINRGTIATTLRIPFTPPSRAVPSISIRGKMSVLLPGRIETFRYDNLAKAKLAEQTKAGVTVTLDQIRKNNDVWEARLRVRFANDAGALESHRAWIFDNEAYLVDAEEKHHDPDGFETTSQSADEVGIAYLFDLTKLDGYSLIYKTPAVLLNLPLEFELKDLELP